jgi:hypothetical protein
LIVNQVKGDYVAKEPNLIAYLAKTNAKLDAFSWFEIIQIPREENSEADALGRLGSGITEDGLGTIPLESLSRPSVSHDEVGTIERTAHPTWMAPLTDFLRRGALPEDRKEVERLKALASKYVLRGEALCKRGYSMPLLRCLNSVESTKVLREIHEGLCENHSAGRSLALKALRQGYFWPTIQRDAYDWARKCDKCQRFSNVPRQPPSPLGSIVVPCTFAKWGVDIIGKLPKAPRQ